MHTEQLLMLVTVGLSVGPAILAAPALPEPVALSDAHRAAVDRPRRIYVNNDVGLPEAFGVDLKQWVYCRFDLFDEADVQVDTIAWCFDEGNLAAYPSKVIPVLRYPGLQKWLAEGIDILRVATDETHRRGKEAFYVYRVNGIDWEDGKAWVKSPLKQEHPEWLEGFFWNFAVPEVRASKLAILRELATNYDFDGIDIDFSRHPPHLPVGHQWENRDALTDFMRQVRGAFQEVARQRGRPLLLAARLPETVAGCHHDGIDIETWVRENLLDIIGVGGRALDLDIVGYRRVIGERSIKLMPSVDDYHAPDGYRHQGIEFWRGLYRNWWHQGIDGAQTFNFFTLSDRAQAEFYAEHPDYKIPPGQKQALREIGDPEAMRFKDALYVLQRREPANGEFPDAWNVFHSRNGQAQIPAALDATGRPTFLSVCVEDDVSGGADRIAGVKLRLLLAGATPADVLEAKLNGVLLETPTIQEDGWRVFGLRPRLFAVGTNLVSLRLAQRTPETQGSVSVEKAEVAVDYRD